MHLRRTENEHRMPLLNCETRTIRILYLSLDIGLKGRMVISMRPPRVKSKNAIEATGALLAFDHDCQEIQEMKFSSIRLYTAHSSHKVNRICQFGAIILITFSSILVSAQNGAELA